MTLVSPARPPTVERIAAPFKGLTYFTENDSEIFFGRNAERVLIATTLLASRFTVVYGESGVGKSSLLRAGVVHDLRERALRERAERRAGGGARFIPVVASDWRDDPIEACDEALRLAAQGLVDGPLPEPFAGKQLDALLESFCKATGATLLIVLDQFEEYLLYHAAEDVVGAGLARALGRRDLNVRFLVSIREDALAKLDRYEGRIPNLFENFIRVEHLDKKAGDAAIRGPIDRYNGGLDPGEQRIEIENELVKRVLAQVERVEPGISGAGSRSGDGARVETAFLQLVIERLWKEEREERSNTLRASTFDRLGGARKIVLAHLGDAMNELTPKQRTIAAKAFGRLVTPSRQKIAYLPSDLAAAEGVAPAEMTTVLERLAERRILRPVAPPPELEEARYEIFHDVLADPVLAWRARHEEVAALRRAEEQQAERQKELTKRIALRVAVVTSVAFAALAAWALHQRNVASDQRAVAQANAAAIVAGTRLQTDSVAGVKAAANAVRIAPTMQAQDALRSALAAAIARVPILLRHRAAVAAARFSRDGTRVVTASDDGAARVWQLPTGRRLVVLRTRDGLPLSAADISPDGDRVVTAGSDDRARVWRLPSGRLLTVLRGHNGPLTDAHFSPDSTLVVTASRDGTARIWQVTTGHLVAILRGHKGAVNAANFSPDGTLLATAGADRTARIWQTATGRSVETLHLPAAVSAAAFSPDGADVVTASGDGFARTWRLRGGRTLLKLPDPVPFASFSADGTLVVTAGPRGSARIWQASTGQLLATLPSPAHYFVQAASFSPDGTRIVTANPVRVWDLSSSLGHAVPVAPNTGASILSAAFTAEGRQVAVGTSDGSVQISRVIDGKRLETVPGGFGPVFGLAFTPDGKRFVAATPARLALFRTATGRRLATLRVKASTVNALAFSSDGDHVVTGGSDGAARIFDAADGHEIEELSGGKQPISAVAFALDGASIVVGQADGTARIFDVASERQVADLRGAGASVPAVAFSPSGDVVATGNVDGTVRIWGRTGQSLAVLRGHVGPVLAVTFSRDGSSVFTAGSDRTVRTYACGFCVGVEDLLRGADRY